MGDIYWIFLQVQIAVSCAWEEIGIILSSRFSDQKDVGAKWVV